MPPVGKIGKTSSVSPFPRALNGRFRDFLGDFASKSRYPGGLVQLNRIRRGPCPGMKKHLEGHLEDTSILGLRLDLSANEYSTMSIDFAQGTCSKFKITPFFGKKT